MKKPYPLIIIGLVLVLISTVYGYYVAHQPLEHRLQIAETHVQEDFDRLLDHIQKTGLPENEPAYPYCELVYDRQGNIQSWTNSVYLPSIDTLRNGLSNWNHQFRIFELPNRIYYIVPEIRDTLVRFFLIPLYVRYEITNSLLPPYVFLGRYYQSDDVSMQNLRITTHKPTEGGEVLTIRDRRKMPLFYIQHFDDNLISQNLKRWIAFSCFVGILILMLGIYQYLLTIRLWRSGWCDISLLVLLFLTRFVLGYFDLPNNFASFGLFSAAETLAFEYKGIVVLSLGDLLINLGLLFLTAWVAFRYLYLEYGDRLYRLLTLKPGLIWLYSLVALALSVWLIREYLNVVNLIFENSQLKIDFSNILAFARSISYQFLLMGLCVLLIVVYLVVSVLLRPLLLQVQQSPKRAARLFATVCSLASALLCAYVFRQEYIYGIIVAVVLAAWAYLNFKHIRNNLLQYSFLNYIILTSAFSLLLCVKIVNYNFEKKEANVVRLAERTFQDRQNTIYSAYDQAMVHLENDPQAALLILQRYQADKNNTRKFLDWVKNEYFNQYFKDTKLQFFLFNTDDKRLEKNLIPIDSFAKVSSNEFAYISLKNPNYNVEEIETSFYRAKSTDRQNYDDIYICVFTVGYLKFQIQIYPTRFDVSRVFPNLLQDNDSRKGSDELKEYEVGFYKNQTLRNSMGESSFPQNMAPYPTDSTEKTKLFDFGDYKDYVFHISQDKAVVVRFHYPKFTDYLNTLSLIFFFIGVFVLLVFALYVIFRNIMLQDEIVLPALDLQQKFQFLLLGLSAIILIVITFFLLITVKERFYAEDQAVLHKNLISTAEVVRMEFKDVLSRPDTNNVKHFFADFSNRIVDLGNKTNTDINIFDSKGELITTTQPTVKQLGISSGLMNDEAFRQLNGKNISEIFLKEKIGNSEFLSAYKALNMGSKFGETIYLNIPYFDKTEELNRKTTNLLGFIISILMLSVILVAIITVYISHYLTSPLKLIQERILHFELGNENEPIEYQQQDEIGAIVKAYNQMLEKLKASEKRLAQNERDLAWKQMARQVAHEIKNPLTPMKLSIQHIVRAWNDKNPNLEKMFPKVTQTLLTQIESLSRIADNFYEFAKMPDTVKSPVVLNEVLREVHTLFKHHDYIRLTKDIPVEEFVILADRDQIQRVFTNLYKNAIQAIENKGGDSGYIHLQMTANENEAYIVFSDNGCGMSEEVKQRAFEPNFTTKSSGSGLGLAMSKRIVEISNGEISFESVENMGTHFYIRFQAHE